MTNPNKKQEIVKSAYFIKKPTKQSLKIIQLVFYVAIIHLEKFNNEFWLFAATMRLSQDGR
ncbi:hypothetical protein [Rahnella variigena]|jgi:hypothetical protein|uniref:hypothetical protein n=1 Tax=Rahnella variigena TaxID=574964 RepID=UPI000DEA652C|nr:MULTISPECIES: hypothetical protein [Rahnella]RBQ33680.1 hypothetical protein C2125_13530 [Rahnella aquatilis]